MNKDFLYVNLTAWTINLCGGAIAGVLLVKAMNIHYEIFGFSFIFLAFILLFYWQIRLPLWLKKSTPAAAFNKSIIPTQTIRLTPVVSFLLLQLFSHPINLYTSIDLLDIFCQDPV